MKHSVTTIINDSLGWGKENLMAWANTMGRRGLCHREVRNRSARIGQAAHQLIEADLKGQPVNFSGNNEPANCFRSFRKWRLNEAVEPIALELNLVSAHYGYTGRLDFYGIVGGAYALVDFKTGGREATDRDFVQQAAYLQLLREHGYRVDRAGLLWLDRGPGVLYEYRYRANLELYWRVFEACLIIYTAKKEGEASGRISGDA